MNTLTLILIVFGYLLVGFFIEILIGGDSYTDDFGFYLILWPVAVGIFIVAFPFLAIYELAMLIRKIFKKE